MPDLTAVDVALLRLVAQRLAGPPAATPLDAVRLLTAVQSQDDPGALVSVALRTRNRSRAEVEAAFDAGAVVRSWPMRGTLHTVVAEDLPWMLRLMTARPLAAAARRRGQLGLTDTDVGRARDAAVAALTGSAGRTRAELLAAFEAAGVATAGGPGYHLIAQLAQQGVLCLGPRRGREHLIVLVEEWITRPRELEHEEALAELALRYFAGHGPATVRDLARWSGLPLGEVRRGVAAAQDGLAHVEVDGTEHLLDPSTPALLEAHLEEARQVLLLPGFDEIILGYADRTATLDAVHADRVVPGGNGVFRPVVLAGGRAVGTWRWMGSLRNRRAVAEPFSAFDDAVAAAIPEVAAQLP